MKIPLKLFFGSYHCFLSWILFVFNVFVEYHIIVMMEVLAKLALLHIELDLMPLILATSFYCSDNLSSPNRVSMFMFSPLLCAIFTDINECRDSADPLCILGECINLQGSFRCTCPEDSVLDSDGRTCREIRKELCYKTVLWNGRCTDPSSEVCWPMSPCLLSL